MESQAGARVMNGCGRRGGGRKVGWGRERWQEGKAGVARRREGEGRNRCERVGGIVVEVEVKGMVSGLRTG